MPAVCQAPTRCFVYGILFNPPYSPLRLILPLGYYSHLTDEKAEVRCVYVAHLRWAQLVIAESRLKSRLLQLKFPNIPKTPQRLPRPGESGAASETEVPSCSQKGGPITDAFSFAVRWPEAADCLCPGARATGSGLQEP